MVNIKAIENIQNPILVFGGVYSNLQALESIKSIAEKGGFSPDRIICTGDIVGYCAQPEACVQLMKDWGVHAIAGNVELQLKDNAEDCGCDFEADGRCDLLSRQWYPFAQENLSGSSLEWIKKLPEFIRFKYENHQAIVLHGSFHRTAEFVFKSTPSEVKLKNFHDTNSQMILAGHCGLPFYDEIDNHHWINAGVIGMPANDGGPHVWFSIVDFDETGNIVVTHETFEYDFNTAAQKMIDAGLPVSYANTLRTGIWDNTEILPDIETAQTGKEIVF